MVKALEAKIFRDSSPSAGGPGQLASSSGRRPNIVPPETLFQVDPAEGIG